MTTNAAPNARRLARLAGVPCPPVNEYGGWTFVIWSDGPYGGKDEPAPRWGHIDVARNRVTEFNPVTCQHEVIFSQDDDAAARLAYVQFQDWAQAQGLEFPCTAGEFIARAAQFAAGDAEIIDALCQQGIGPNWQD